MNEQRFSHNWSHLLLCAACKLGVNYSSLLQKSYLAASCPDKPSTNTARVEVQSTIFCFLHPDSSTEQIAVQHSFHPIKIFDGTPSRIPSTNQDPIPKPSRETSPLLRILLLKHQLVPPPNGNDSSAGRPHHGGDGAVLEQGPDPGAQAADAAAHLETHGDAPDQGGQQADDEVPLEEPEGGIGQGASLDVGAKRVRRDEIVVGRELDAQLGADEAGGQPGGQARHDVGQVGGRGGE